MPTVDDATLGDEVLDDATRPRAVRHPSAVPTRLGRANAQRLVQVHDHLRSELDQLRDVLDQLAAGALPPGTARDLINELTMRQNYWSVGAFCATYCRLLTLHHTIEDQHLFSSLRQADGELAPVLDRLSAEHELIAGLLSALDDALVGMIADRVEETGLARVRVVFDQVSDRLLSHLAYEEDELVEAIGRLGIQL